MTGSDRRGLLDDIETFMRSDFGGRVTRPLVATLTTATLRSPGEPYGAQPQVLQ